MEPCLVQASFPRALIVLQNRPGGSKVLDKRKYHLQDINSIACFMRLIFFFFFFWWKA